MSGAICNRGVPALVKGKVYKKVLRADMSKQWQKAELEVAELNMLRFSLGVTRVDRIRNEYIRGTAQVGHFGDKARE